MPDNTDYRSPQFNQIKPKEDFPTEVFKKTSNRQFLFCIFIGIMFLVIGIVVGYYLAINRLPPSNVNTCPDSSSSIKTICPTCGLSPSPTIAQKSLPKITNRIQSNKDYSSWSIYEDARGYTFNYPKDWFLSAGGGEAFTIHNWDPDIIRDGPPIMLGNDSKWDVGFVENNFQNISDVLIKETKSKDERVDLIEKSKTIHGLDVYFIQGTYPDLDKGQDKRKQFIEAIVLNNDKYFSWNGYYTGADNIKILKEIVESIGLNE